jgi:hypothetical protein
MSDPEIPSFTMEARRVDIITKGDTVDSATQMLLALEKYQTSHFHVLFTDHEL